MSEVLARAIADNGAWDKCAWLRDLPTGIGDMQRAIVETLTFRNSPSPVEDGSLAGAFLDATEGAVLVLEPDERHTSTFSTLLPTVSELALSSGVSVIVVTAGKPSRTLRRLTPNSLILDTSQLVHAKALAVGLDEEFVERVGAASASADAVLFDLAGATERLSAAVVKQAVRSAGRRRSFLQRLTCNLIEATSEAEREALSTALRTGYWHPQFSGGSVPTANLRPWVVDLEHGWGWIRPIWRRSLAHELPYQRSRSRSVPRPGPSIGQGRVGATWRPIVDVRLLGPFEVRIDGSLVEGVAGLGGNVLRFLLTKPHRSAHRDELIEQFWPEADPRLARNRLQVAVSGLRKAVRSASTIDIVDFADGRYRISDRIEVQVDALEFERQAAKAKASSAAGDRYGAASAAATAIRHYRGNFCPDLPFEEWTIAPRERIRMLYTDVLELLLMQQWELADHDGCVDTARKMLDEDPCWEEAHRALMRSFLALGRRHQALRQYESCRRLLKATAGALPSPSTVVLYTSVRDGSSNR